MSIGLKSITCNYAHKLITFQRALSSKAESWDKDYSILFKIPFKTLLHVPYVYVLQKY